MASLRDIRRKIAAVKNINKITQAMKMVAAAKLRRAQERVDAARPYAEKLRELIAAVAPRVSAEVTARHALLATRESGGVGMVVITSDRGLCGSYNNNLIRRAQAFLEERRSAGEAVELITIGRKGHLTLRTRGFASAEHFAMVGVDAPFSDIEAISRAVVGLYTRTEAPVREVWVAFTRFHNAVTQVPTIDRFLPIEAGGVLATGGGGEVEYEFDPSEEALLEVLLPRFVHNQVYQYLLEAGASEQGARMTAMSQASDNAGELIGTLTLQYNRARQDAITKEILDIVGGAEALAAEG